MSENISEQSVAPALVVSSGAHEGGVVSESTAPPSPPESQLTAQTAMDIFRNNIETLVGKITNYNGSRKQLQRVLTALAIHPFSDKPSYHPYKEEKELYDLFSEVEHAKMVMYHVALEEKKQAETILKENAEKLKEGKSDGESKTN